MSSLLFALFTIEVSSADGVYLRFLELFFLYSQSFLPPIKKIGSKRTHGGQRAQTKLARSSPQWALHINYSAESPSLTAVSLLRPPSCCRKTCLAVQEATAREEGVGAWIAVVAAAAAAAVRGCSPVDIA